MIRSMSRTPRRYKVPNTVLPPNAVDSVAPSGDRIGLRPIATGDVRRVNSVSMATSLSESWIVSSSCATRMTKIHFTQDTAGHVLWQGIGFIPLSSLRMAGGGAGAITLSTTISWPTLLTAVTRLQIMI